MINARRIAEILSRKVVLKRNLPVEFNRGPLYVSPAAALKHWRFDLWKVDPMLFEVILDNIKPGNVVWDIGANVGLFSFAAANVVGENGKVLAIEADTFLVDLLRKSAGMDTNAKLNVDVLPVAISDSIGIAKFNVAKRGRAANHLAAATGSSQTGGVRETQLVPTVTLDWLLERYPVPAFIKIDVEGAEDKVFEGARKLLSEIKPGILCEVTGNNRRAISEVLKNNGYKLYNAESFRKHKLPCEDAPFNTLALPS